MGVKATNVIGWRTADNKVDEKIINGSLAHTLQSRKKIKRRTKALNIELKRFSTLKSYRQYVSAKTAILRSITDNEDTDEDNDANNSRMCMSRNSLLSQTNDMSIGSCNLNSDHETASPDSSQKYKKKSKKTNKIKNSLSRSTRKNGQEKKEESIVEKRKARPKIASRSSSKNTEDTGLKDVTRNLTNDSSSSLNKSDSDHKTASPDSSPKHTKDTKKTNKIKFPSMTETKNCQEKEQDSTVETRKTLPKIASDSLTRNTGKKGSKDVTNDPPIGSSNSDSDHKTASNSSPKHTKKTKIKYNLSITTTRNCRENNQGSTVEKHKSLPKIASNSSRKNSAEKGLKNATRNLTFALENLGDDPNRVNASQEISPVAHSTQIQNGDVKDDVCDNTETWERVDDQTNAEHRDSVLCSGFQDNKDDVANEMTDNGDEEVKNEEDEKMKEEPVENLATGSSSIKLKEEEEEEESGQDENLSKKPQPVITSTEIVKAKYKIVRNEGETDPTADDGDASLVESFPLPNSPSSSEGELVIDEEANEEDELSPESKRIGQMKRMNLITNSSESEDSQDDEQVEVRVETVKNVALLGSSRMDVSDESDADISDMRLKTRSSSQKISEVQEDELSPESKRVSQMKRINLITNSSESEESQDEKQEEVRVEAVKNIASLGSSLIDSDESNADILDMRLMSRLSSQHISEVEEDELSPQSKRVSQMKRINLITNSSESEESQDDEQVEARVETVKNVDSPSSTHIDDSDESDADIGNLRAPRLSSQKISDPSDTDESDAEPHATKSSSGIETKKEQLAAIGVANKSIKSQIREQENSNSLTVVEKFKEEKDGDDGDGEKRTNKNKSSDDDDCEKKTKKKKSSIHDDEKRTKKKKSNDKINHTKGEDQNSNDLNNGNDYDDHDDDGEKSPKKENSNDDDGEERTKKKKGSDDDDDGGKRAKKKKNSGEIDFTKAEDQDTDHLNNSYDYDDDDGEKRVNKKKGSDYDDNGGKRAKKKKSSDEIDHTKEEVQDSDNLNNDNHYDDRDDDSDVDGEKRTKKKKSSGKIDSIKGEDQGSDNSNNDDDGEKRIKKKKSSDNDDDGGKRAKKKKSTSEIDFTEGEDQDIDNLNNGNDYDDDSDNGEKIKSSDDDDDDGGKKAKRKKRSDEIDYTKVEDQDSDHLDNDNDYDDRDDADEKWTKKKKSSDEINYSEAEDGDNLNNNVNLRAVKNRAPRFDHSSECEIENSKRTSSGREEEGTRDFRPIELGEFVDREGLVASQESSTMTVKDLKHLLQEDEDGIWLIDIPKSIITNVDELCGKNIAFEKEKMTINGTSYKTTIRHEKSVSCILHSGKKKARFKTVNLNPVGCIVVRQESSGLDTAPPLVETDAAAQQLRVPFPKNLKSRNPLVGLNTANGITDFLTPKSSTHESEMSRKRKRKISETKSHEMRKKLKRKFWHGNNLNLKRKEETT